MVIPLFTLMAIRLSKTLFPTKELQLSTAPMGAEHFWRSSVSARQLPSVRR